MVTVEMEGKAHVTDDCLYRTWRGGCVVAVGWKAVIVAATSDRT